MEALIDEVISMTLLRLIEGPTIIFAVVGYVSDISWAILRAGESVIATYSTTPTIT